jgi:hypothetical protein
MKLPLEGRWLGLAAVIAAGFVGALLVAVRFIRLPAPESDPNSATPRTGGLGIASVTSNHPTALLREQSLLDPDPLFLPTEFNASQPKLPALIRREPGATFQQVASKYTFFVAQAQIVFPEPVALPEAVDALNYGEIHNPYESLGRFNRDEQVLPERQAFIEVVSSKTGRIVFSAPVSAPGAPAQLATADWRPLELLAAVDATGLIGSPVLSRGSGIELIDSFFRSYLAKQFHLGERLPPGFYALRVGP